MKRPSLRSRQGGFTLVEVLVALVIFTFGLLGAAGLVLSSLQADKYASNSVTASSMAREYSELMQMIPDGVSSTHTSTSSSTGTLMVDTASLTSSDANACTGAGKTCTPQEMIAVVRSDWASRVDSPLYLPSGRGEVCRDSTPRNAAGELQWGGCDETGDTVLIKMGWLGKPAVGSGGAVDLSWMTADRPRFAVSAMGNLRDYVSH